MKKLTTNEYSAHTCPYTKFIIRVSREGPYKKIFIDTNVAGCLTREAIYEMRKTINAAIKDLEGE